MNDLDITTALLVPLVVGTPFTDKEKIGMNPLLWMQVIRWCGGIVWVFVCGWGWAGSSCVCVCVLMVYICYHEYCVSVLLSFIDLGWEY